jgi:hypothetical protein
VELNKDNWDYIASVKDASLVMNTLLVWLVTLQVKPMLLPDELPLTIA